MEIHIKLTIDDKIINFLKTISKPKKIFSITMFCLISIGIILYAADIEKPHNFQAGSTISSTQVNENFDILFTKFNELYKSGSIIMFGGNFAPAGWLLCDGRAISRTDYKDLFEVIGITFGMGDGSSTFNVPDMRGIFPKGAGTTDRSTGKDAANNFYSAALGSYSQDKMQGHWHGLYDSTAGGFTIGFRNLAYNSGTSMSALDVNLTTSYAGQMISNGTNGTPRTGSSTEPQSLGLNFIIKH